MEESYIDSQNRMLCGRHHREVCQDCMEDHRVTNEITRKGKNADIDAILEWHDRIQKAEMHAMIQQHVKEGGTGPIELGTEECQRLYDLVASRPNQGRCARCFQSTDRLLKCSRCQAAWYCSKECQTADYPMHKTACRAAAASGTSSDANQSEKKNLISWSQLAALKGAPATGKILELRVMTKPIPFMRHIFEGKDHKGSVHRVSFYSSSAPPGLEQGKVMKWRNPRFHRFLDQSTGARIEDGDLANITVH